MSTPDPARGRVLTLLGVRLAGLLLVLMGLWWVGLHAPAPRGLLGIVPLVAGMALFLLGPRLLVRRWRG